VHGRIDRPNCIDENPATEHDATRLRIDATPVHPEFPCAHGVAPVDHPVGVARGLKRVRAGLTNQYIWPSPVARSVGTLQNACASAIQLYCND